MQMEAEILAEADIAHEAPGRTVSHTKDKPRGSQLFDQWVE
jgi:hypothetical protein